MPKRGAFALALTAFALVLLLNFQTPAGVGTVAARGARPGAAAVTDAGGPSATTESSGSSGSTGSTGSTGTSGSSGSGGSGGANGPAGGVGSTNAAGTHAVTGPTIETRFGPVQVSVTLDGARLVDVSALQLPSGGRSSMISGYVEPILRSEALQAQSANIDGISGATYTSQAYERSLQAALDSAGG